MISMYNRLTKSRTVKVTMCIILERTAPSPSTVIVFQGTRLSKTRCRCLASSFGADGCASMLQRHCSVAHERPNVVRTVSWPLCEEGRRGPCAQEYRHHICIVELPWKRIVVVTRTHSSHRFWQQFVQGAREAEAVPEERNLDSLENDAHEEMAHLSSNRNTTRQKPDDTRCFKHVAIGSKASGSKKQELNSKPVSHLQLLTGALPRIKAREVCEGDPV